MYFWNSNPIIANTILWGDSATDGPEIYIQGSASPTVSYCNIEGGWEGVGNIDIDPLFRDPGNDDYHLMATYCGDPYDSPCIDAGDPTIMDDSLDCDWGLGTTRSDMGAYGGNDSMQVGINPTHKPKIPTEFALHQNYPNPFNATTVLSYDIPTTGRINLTIYNVLGQKVEVIVDQIQRPGSHSVVWDASLLTSGIYFAILRYGDHAKTVKLLLLK